MRDRRPTVPLLAARNSSGKHAWANVGWHSPGQLRRRWESILDADSRFTHPFVIGELACGALRHREAVLPLLEALSTARLATPAEALALVDGHRLAGTGIGWVDAHRVAAARLSHLRSWTRDRRLRAAAQLLTVGHG